MLKFESNEHFGLMIERSELYSDESQTPQCLIVVDL